MVKLTDEDEELLELAALSVPWNMVCAEFHQRYGSTGALARRVFELERAGLLKVTPNRGEEAPSAAALEADALANGSYADADGSENARWTVLVTDKGFDRIEGRLKEQ